MLRGMHMIEAALFDLGKVLLDWDPRYFYARYFPGDARALEAFVATAIASPWIQEMDAGKPIAQAVEERQRLFPQHAALIGLWQKGWPSMLRGEIAGTAAILRDLKARGVRLYALTNFSAETYPVAMSRCPTLTLFEDVVVSADIGLIKPDPRIYAHAIERCRLRAAHTVFVDDLEINVRAAVDAGLRGLHFTTPERLRDELEILIPR